MYEELEQVRYEAFFDELGQLEKQAMFSKIAKAPPGFFRQLWGGAQHLYKRPGSAVKGIRDAYGKGSLFQEATGGGRPAQIMGGLKQVWKTPQGKAAIVGGAGTVGAIGGTGYLMGRGSRGGQNQNVYVR